MSFEILFLVAVLAGFVGSISGIGGGVIFISIFNSFGLDIKQAIALSTISAIAVSNSAAPRYVRTHIPNLKACAFLEVFVVIGAVVGAFIALKIERRPLLLLCGGILLLSSMLLLRQRKQEWKQSVQQDPFSRWIGFKGSYYDDAEKRTIFYEGGNALLGVPSMFGAGIAAGLGVGGNALSILINNVLLGFPPKVSLTMSTLWIGVMALASASVYLEAGLINAQWAAVIVLGVPVGAFLGSKLFVRLTNRIVRTIFLRVLFLLSLEMIARGCGWIR